jgi:hypothetical protein
METGGEEIVTSATANSGDLKYNQYQTPGSLGASEEAVGKVEYLPCSRLARLFVFQDYRQFCTIISPCWSAEKPPRLGRE